VINSDGSRSNVPVMQVIPSYQFLLPGGDTAAVFNYEYRIPIVGPVTLAPFVDAGMNRLTMPGQLGLNADRVQQLNGEFPQADFGKRAYIPPGTQPIRVSAGIELQVLMPVVNAPFRLYWAYNLSSLNTSLQPPVVADRSFFPNEETYQQAVKNPINGVGLPIPWGERKSLFRFSVGRTF
jgi:outer membrane protein insertion porin family